VQLHGKNRLLSDFASDLGKALQNQRIFRRDKKVFIIDENGVSLVPVTEEMFRTWVEQFVVCYRKRTKEDDGDGPRVIEQSQTMTKSEAAGVLSAPQFVSKLKEISRFNPVRMPFRGHFGDVELLNVGYDCESRVYTAHNAPKINESMSLESAREIVDRLLNEFPWADCGRSRSVAVAAMVSVYALGILPEKSLRPCFIYLANIEGSGKSTLVKLATVPVLGYSPATVLPKEDEEMNKLLSSQLFEGKPVLCFDNVKAHLSSPCLEGFLTAPDWNGRILGSQATFSLNNNVTVFVTRNGCTVSPDMRRRSLFCELHSEEEKTENRIFQKKLEVSVLLEPQLRSSILSALWTFVKEWIAADEPHPSRGSSSFCDWAEQIGGVVENAGYGCPLDSAEIEAAADVDGNDMRSLVKSIVGNHMSKSVDFNKIVLIAQTEGLFEGLIIGMQNPMKESSCKAALGKLLKRYDRRKLGDYRFSVIGAGHSRKYEVTRVNAQALNSTSKSAGVIPPIPPRRKPHLAEGNADCSLTAIATTLPDNT